MNQKVYATILFGCSSVAFCMQEQKNSDVVIDVAPQSKTAQEILKIGNSTQFNGQLQYLVTKHRRELIHKKRSKAKDAPEKELEALENLNNELDTLESHLISETHDFNQQAEKLFNNERLKDIGIGSIWLVSALATGGSALYLVLDKNQKTEDKVGGGVPLFTAFLGFGYQMIQSYVTAFNNDSINTKINENLQKSKNVSDVKNSIERSIKKLRKKIEKGRDKEDISFREISLDNESK